MNSGISKKDWNNYKMDMIANKTISKNTYIILLWIFF